MSDYQTLNVTLDGKVAIVTVNRPEKLNALNAQVIDELGHCFAALGGNREIGAIVLTGSGEKAFVAGADIKELAAQSPSQMLATSATGQRVFLSIERLGIPVIAAVNGYALGGGLELAMSCTLRTASENAKLGLPEITLGILPGYAGTQRLVRLVGRGKAIEMMLTGEPIGAQDALRLGLVNHVFPAAELQAKTLELARKLASRAPLAVRAILRAVNEGTEQPLVRGSQLEAELFSELAGTQDTQEGLRAFLEKRQAQFKGQ